MNKENEKEIKSCCFFGHRDIEITQSLQDEVCKTVIDLVVNKGVREFYFGAFGDFDNMCHSILKNIAIEYPCIKQIFCGTDDKHIRQLKKYNALYLEEFDQIITFPLDFDYWYTRIYYRNCEIIKCSDYVVFYIRNKDNSGAYKSYKYAKKIKKEIIEL